MVFFNSMQSVLTILMMIIIGYILTNKGWFDEKTLSLFSKLVVNIAFPSYMISNLMSNFNKDKLSSLASGFIVPFIIIITAYCLSLIAAKIFKIDKNKRGVFCALFAFSNSMFIGLPVNQGLFGEIAVPYVLLYYISSTSLFWTIGNYGISKDNSTTNDKSTFISFFSIDTLKRIFSPPFIAFLFTISLILLEIKLPPFIMDTCKYIGNLTTPLAMFFTGIVIQSISLKDFKFDSSMIIVLVGRFIISPLVALAVVYYFPLDIVLMKKVFVTQTALPVMSQVSILSKKYNGDYKFASIMVTLSTTGSLIIIPIYMLIITALWK